ncbi:MAG: S24 family peptidase [Weeksellaceae bacterium]
MQSILDRISKLAEIEDITITALEREVGASKGVFSRALKNNTDIQTKWLTRIVEIYPQYDPRWLIAGEEPMLRNNIMQVAEPSVQYQAKSKTDPLPINHQYIPIYSLEASAGIVSLFKDMHKHEPIDFLQIPNLPKSDGAVYVTGDSMYPLLKSGDIVVYKKLAASIENIFFGEMYLISVSLDHDGDITTVKWIQKSEQGNEYVKLVSQNQHHQSKDVHLSKIRALAIIKASIRINSMS